jgi:hypothetical protein
MREARREEKNRRGAGHNTQFAVYRAAGRFSAPRGETLLLFPKTSARCLPLESLARGCSGSRFFCVPGHAVQGGSSRAPSPARPLYSIYPGRGPTHGPLSNIIAARMGYIPSQKSAKPNAPQGRVFNADRGPLRCGPASGTLLPPLL